MTDDIDEIMMLLNSMPSGVEKENENSVAEKVAIQSVPVEPKAHKSSANDLDDLIASIATLNQEAKENIPEKAERPLASIPPVKPVRRNKGGDLKARKTSSTAESEDAKSEARKSSQATHAEIDSLIDELDEQITKNQTNKRIDANVSHKQSDNPLDDMLGELTDDLASRGIHAKSKGECPTCNRAVIGEAIAALGRVWHPEHFVCCVDDKEIGQEPYYTWKDTIYCRSHYEELFSPECAVCGGAILENLIQAMNKSFHAHCFVCASCNCPVLDNFHEHEEKPYCPDCYAECVAPKCLSCNNAILNQYIAALDGYWHPECFICHEPGCGPFLRGSFFEYNGKPYCELCYLAKKGGACAVCQKPINGKCVSALGKRYHPECFVCTFCKQTLTQAIFKEHNQKPFCHVCHKKYNLHNI